MSISGMSFAPLRDAVREGRPDVVDVALEVGASAARLGVPLHEVLDHVERAYVPDEPSFAASRAAAVAWAEAALIRDADVACEDPLTTLATVPYLRSRLSEIYRGAASAGRRASETCVLVVAELPRTHVGHELEQSLRALEVAQVLRTVFAGEETVAQLSSRRFAVVARRERADDVTVALLGLLLERSVGEHGQPRLWVEQLPASIDGVAVVLAGLCE